ncbi:hypothetical protein HY251_17540 [bacterium]|nr:hypothetical protein [bacterium]
MLAGAVPTGLGPRRTGLAQEEKNQAPLKVLHLGALAALDLPVGGDRAADAIMSA